MRQGRPAERRLAWVFVLLPGLVSAVIAASCGGDLSRGGSDAAATADGLDVSRGENPLDTGGDMSTDGAACLIQASSYDQSCSVSSDCIAQVGNWPVQFGDYCQPLCLCGGDSINRTSATQYENSILATPIGSGEIAPQMCSCQDMNPPCCLMGQCAIEGCPADIVEGGMSDGEYSVDSGEPDGSVLCIYKSGPSDAGEADSAARWCTPPAVCTPIGGGWECCTKIGGTLCTPAPDQ